MLPHAHNLMHLHAQSPARMREAVADGGRGVGLASGSVHRLEEEVPEVEPLEALRLRSRLGEGWALSFQGRLERADNPGSQSGLDHSADAYGASLTWDHPQGKGGFFLGMDRNRIRTRTDLVLPGGGAALSDYDLRLWTAEAGGYVTFGRLALDGSLLRIKDSGGTWPSSGWVGDLRATLQGPRGTRLGLFAQRRTYDEARGSVDDFRFSRYGAVIGWRF